MTTSHGYTISKPIVLAVTLGFCMLYGQGVFGALEDLKSTATFPPVVTISHRGDAIVLWQEYTKETAHKPRHYYFYVRVVTADGQITVPKREIDSWRMNRWGDNGRRIGGRSTLWTAPDELLVIGWNIENIGSDPVGYRPEKIILDLSGTVLTGPDTCPVGFGDPDATLVQDSKKIVYAIQYDWSGIHIIQVHPEFGTRKQTTKSNLNSFYSFATKRQQLLLRDAVVAITANNQVLLCHRLHWGETPYEERGEWETAYPNKIFYVLADLDGNFVSEPVICDLHDYSFRKIPGIHLGGIYYASEEIQDIDDAKASVYDLDLTKLPSGDIILSATGEDKYGKLCVYQIKFDQNGKLMRAEETETVHARPFPKDAVLPVSKVVTFQSASSGYAHFGFDEDGQFYSERLIWESED